MARDSICAKLLADQNFACEPPVRKYVQQFVAINKSDIDPETVVITKTDPDTETPVCAYNVQFELFEGRKGFFFQLPENGTSVFGTFDKSTSDLGFVQYIHNVNAFVAGAGEETKCILEALDKGSYVIALQLVDGTVEIYGLRNGLSTADYTYDLQTNGGGSAIILTTNENTPEGDMPMVYAPASGGDANADFNSAFENPETT